MIERPDSVVVEELDALARVRTQLADLPPVRTASEIPILRELERLRERLLSGDENKDHSALTEQYHNQSAILHQLRSAGQGTPVDPASPYFAHLRLEEEGQRRGPDSKAHDVLAQLTLRERASGGTAQGDEVSLDGRRDDAHAEVPSLARLAVIRRAAGTAANRAAALFRHSRSSSSGSLSATMPAPACTLA